MKLYKCINSDNTTLDKGGLYEGEYFEILGMIFIRINGYGSFLLERFETDISVSPVIRKIIEIKLRREKLGYKY